MLNWVYGYLEKADPQERTLLNTRQRHGNSDADTTLPLQIGAKCATDGETPTAFLPFWHHKPGSDGLYTVLPLGCSV